VPVCFGRNRSFVSKHLHLIWSGRPRSEWRAARALWRDGDVHPFCNAALASGGPCVSGATLSQGPSHPSGLKPRLGRRTALLHQRSFISAPRKGQARLAAGDAALSVGVCRAGLAGAKLTEGKSAKPFFSRNKLRFCRGSIHFHFARKKKPRTELKFIFTPSLPSATFCVIMQDGEYVAMTNVNSGKTRSRTLARFSEMLEYTPAEPLSTSEERQAPQLARKGRARRGLYSV